MNQISTVSYFVVDRFKSNPLVNTITFEKTEQMDYNKENLYPLVNIDIIRSTPQGSIVLVEYIITVAEARDVDNEANYDKLFGSNLIDNLNETHEIALKFINELQKLNNDDEIDVETVTTIDFIKLDKGALDCARFTVTLSTANDTPAC